jgi:hypothetical protein
MKYITIILNSAFMTLCGLGSCIAHFKVSDILKRPKAYHEFADNFPGPTELAIKLHWMWKFVPITWAALSLVLILVLLKNKSCGRDLVGLHTSATLLVGLAMLIFFLTTGIVPFLDRPPITFN